MSKIENVAIIMDGNGRWAKERGRPRFWGHVRGTQVVSQIVEAAHRLHLKSLTLFAFSTENWRRPDREIFVLFKLLQKYLLKEQERLLQNGVRFKVIGHIDRLPPQTQEMIRSLEEKGRHNSGLNLYLAFDYGSYSEILETVNAHILENPGVPLTEEEISHRLGESSVATVDLLIRTSGEQRLSNFLLWQLAYAELYFTPLKWPDFTEEEFRRIYFEVSGRERRFGALL